MARAGRHRSPIAHLCRFLAGLLVAAAIAGFATLKYCADPVTVRRLVLEQLRKQFPGAEVTVDSARLWPGWGIQLTNLTLARKDDPSLTPVLQVPVGRIEHDADALTQGRLRIRRLKFDRPRLNAIRDVAGRWNVDGLIAPPKPGVPLPIIVVERGSVVVRIVAPTGAESVWKFDALRGSMLEESGLARFEARAAADQLGRVGLEGVWRRDRGHVDAALDWREAPLSPRLLHELSQFVALPVEQIRTIAGTARLQLDARRRPEETPAWVPDVRLSVAGGRLGVRDLPIDFDDICLTARYGGGRLTVSELTARAAGAPVRATLTARVPAASPLDAVESVAVAVDGFLVTPELFARLPESARRFQQRFNPVGRMSIEYRFARRPGGGWNARLESRPEDIAARYHKFPYPIRRVRGKVVNDYASDQPDHHAIDLTAELNEGAKVCIRGTVAGAEPYPAVDVWLTGEGDQPARGIPVDDDLIRALPPRFQPLARSFHFRGHADLVARIHHAEGCPLGHDQYHIQCHGASVCYDAFPVPLENVAANLEIHLGPGLPGDPNRGDHWVLRNATASHGQGAIRLSAWNTAISHGQQITVDMTGAGMPLGESLRAALARYRLGPTWDLLAPSGQIDFNARLTVTDKPDGGKEPVVALGVRGARIKPAFFPYALSDLTAKVHATVGRAVLGECTARHGDAVFKFSGGEIRTDHGLWVDVRDIAAGSLRADDELVAALPPVLQRACGALQPTGAFDVDVRRLVLHDPPAVPGPPGPPVLYWDGTLGLRSAGWNAGVPWDEVVGTIACRGAAKGNRLDWLQGHMALDRATLLRQPTQRLHAQLQVEPQTPDVLQIRGVQGRLFGGAVAGEGRIAFGGGIDYAFDLKALGIQLEEFARQNGIGGKLEGRATAQLYLTGRGSAVDEMSGRADIDVPSGKLYDLPLALELLKAVSLRAPDGVAFDEAHAQLKIEGRRLRVNRLDMLGSAVSLGGRGELNLDGTGVNLDFYAVWARIAQVLPASWRDMPAGVSSQILKIKMRGSLVDPQFAPEPVPFIVEPVQRLLDRMSRRP
jgi:hypothetical protein